METYRPFRYPTETPVAVKTPLGRVKAKVLDVNDGGMRLSVLQGVDVGHKISIDVLGFPIKGIVRWVGKDSLGVIFRPKISTRHVDALRQGNRTGRSHHLSSHSFKEMR